MSRRDALAQQEPRERLPWRDFPRYAVRANRVLYRSVRNGRGAWYFCACGKCRFDLPGPRGTCYAGTDPVCGVMETVGFELLGLLPSVDTPYFFSRRKIHSVRLPQTFYVANLVTRAALRFGVTNELSCMTPYAIPQKFAALFDRIMDKRGKHRFHGIRYRTRFDTGSAVHGLALFDASGEQPWITLDCRDVDDELVRKISDQHTVALPPAIDDLEVDDYDGMDDVA